jgi:3-hydroxyisobutyrate dehydrogenase-like beta-hydroxyacid dehydrogenase
MTAFHEGVMLAAHGGIDPTVTARAMTEFANGPAMAQSRAPYVLDVSGPGGCDTAVVRKRIRLALETAHASGLKLPVAAAVERALGRVKESGRAYRGVAARYEGVARS